MFKRTRVVPTSDMDIESNTIDAIKNAKPGDIPHIIGTQSVDDEDILVAIRDILPSFSLPDILCRIYKAVQERNEYVGTDVEQLYNIIRDYDWYIEASNDWSGNGPTLYLECISDSIRQQIYDIGFVPYTGLTEKNRYILKAPNPINIAYGIHLFRDFDKYSNLVYSDVIRDINVPTYYLFSSI